MKTLILTAMAMVAIAFTTVAQEVVETEGCPIAFDATLDFYSHYAWRGIEYNDEPVAQPGAAARYDMAEYGSVSAGVWANYDFTNFKKHDGRGDGFSEIDYTLNYAVDVEDLTLEAGHIWYTFPVKDGQDESSTREVYGSVAYNNDIVVPSLTVYYDYADIEGFYGNAALSKNFEIAEQVTAGLFASLGAGDDNYNKGYGLTRDNALIDGNLGACVTYAINDIFSVGATAVWTSVLDDGIRENVDADQHKDILWGGINLAASF
ncbi:MAG: hypothetical protein R6V06_09980 [Kiritimatiellia bacterium]